MRSPAAYPESFTILPITKAQEAHLVAQSHPVSDLQLAISLTEPIYLPLTTPSSVDMLLLQLNPTSLISPIIMFIAISSLCARRLSDIPSAACPFPSPARFSFFLRSTRTFIIA
jgi:hypothetical protein